MMKRIGILMAVVVVGTLAVGVAMAPRTAEASCSGVGSDNYVSKSKTWNTYFGNSSWGANWYSKLSQTMKKGWVMNSYLGKGYARGFGRFEEVAYLEAAAVGSITPSSPPRLLLLGKLMGSTLFDYDLDAGRWTWTPSWNTTFFHAPKTCFPAFWVLSVCFDVRVGGSFGTNMDLTVNSGGATGQFNPWASVYGDLKVSVGVPFVVEGGTGIELTFISAGPRLAAYTNFVDSTCVSWNAWIDWYMTVMKGRVYAFLDILGFGVWSHTVLNWNGWSYSTPAWWSTSGKINMTN